jgi:succinyl-CoA synthetase alpha subunit
MAAAGTAHTNSTAETTVGYVALPPGTFGLGKIINAKGILRATATDSTDTLTVVAYMYTTAVVVSGTALGTSGAVDAANDNTVSFDLTFSPYTAQGSTAGTIVVHGTMTAVGAEGTVTARAVYQLLSSIDFTATQYIGIGADWSVAAAANSCRMEAFDVIEIT